MVVIAGSAFSNGLVAYHMKRMSVSSVFAYTYIGSLAVGALPGCLFCAFSFLTAAFRPDRDPHIQALLYDLGLLTFVGSLGCFATQYMILAIAIFLDRNNIFPRWFAYVSHLAGRDGGAGRARVRVQVRSLRVERLDQFLYGNRHFRTL